MAKHSHSSRKRRSRRFASAAERLESRQLLSVSLDANGYTVVTPTTTGNFTTNVIYVSSSTGNDANSGTSPSAPVQTLLHAQKMLRSGYPDWMLLKRGDTFSEVIQNWGTSGLDAQDPLVIGAYGTGPRPVMASNRFDKAFSTTGGTVKYLDIIGINFYDNYRDPNSPSFNLAGGGGAAAIQFYASGGDLLLEDCSFSFYKNNLDIEGLNGPLQNVTIRRCIISDSWSSNSHSQGIYSYAVDNITLYQNVFDHNGWNTQIAGAGQAGFNHNIYFAFNVTGVDIEQNIIANASFAGVMVRSGKIDDNIFLTNAIAVSFGEADGASSTLGGVSGELVGNIVIGDKGVGTTTYGMGFDIGNTKPGANVMVSNNIFTQPIAASTNAILLDMATNTSTPQNAVGENDVTVSNNITNGWYRGIMTDGRFDPGGTGLYALNDLKVINNQFIGSTNRLVRHDGGFDPTQEFWSGNEYYTASLTPNNWFALQNFTLSPDQWGASIDPTGTYLSAPPPFADPNRGITSYDMTLGGPGTLDDFIAHARQMSATNYQPVYMAQAVADYVRNGFGLDTTPPTASTTFAPVGASSLNGTTSTFSVTYTDDFALDASSLGSNNIFVTGPNGFSQFATYVGAAAPTVGTSGFQQTVVTYQISAPGGTWTAADEGKYSVTLLANKVRDAAGNFTAGAMLGSFGVDLTPPTASASAANVGNSSAGLFSYTFTLTFSDPSGISVFYLAKTNQVEVTGPDYDGFATLNSVHFSAAATEATASYSIAAPGGAWSASDNGLYSISLSSPVQDNYGNALNGLLATFTTQIGLGNQTPPPGAISGTIFNDANGNAVEDSRETPLAGVVVFLDSNLNGVYDPFELRTTTDVNGHYAFTGLGPGMYVIREELPDGYIPTSSTSGANRLVFLEAQKAMVNFANQLNLFVANQIADSVPK